MFAWLTLDGQKREAAICPEHAGAMSRVKPGPIDGEQTLW